MRIKKVSQSIPIKAKVVNSYSESEEETYSCDYINNVKANSSDVYTKTEIDTKLNTNNYSQEEQVIGKWDNKPLYRKYFFISALPNNTYKDYYVSVNNLEYIKKLSGMAYTDTDFIPIPDVSASSFIRLVALGKSTSSIGLRIQTTADRSDMRGIIIMEYTKTTD